jgi:hypothetical protein
MINEYEAVGRIKIDKENRSFRGKPAPVTLCSLQILYDLTWDLNHVAAVGSQLLTACAMERRIDGV